MSDLDGRIAGLSEAKRRLLARRLAAGVAGAIPSRDPTGPWPLSFAQRRHWFLHELDPDNPVFNATNAVRVIGRLDVPALQQALHALVGRHEVLRTGYALQRWEPVQYVYSDWDYRLPVIELDADGEGGLEHRLRRQIAAAHEPHFDLVSDLKHRSVLIRLGSTEHVLVRTTHRIASDRWSTGIHNRELAVLYAAFAQQREPGLEPLPIQYADYAVWQRQRFTDDSLGRHLTHFERRLAGAPSVLELPSDRPRPAMQTNRGETFHEPLPPALTDGIRALAMREGCTPFMVMLTAFSVLLARYTRQRDLVIGVPTAGRTRTETEGLIGLFINTLVLRVQLEPGPTFRDLLSDVRREVLDGLAHQELPFERLVEHLQPERHLNRAPVFQFMFDYLNTPTTALEFDGTRTERLPLAEDSAVYDLSLYAFDQGEEIALAWEYAVDLFDRASVVRMAGAFRSLLSAALSDPETPVDRLPLLDAAGRDRILAAGMGDDAAGPVATAVAGFVRQATMAPSAPAVRYEGEVTSYGQLLEATERLAGFLGSVGVAPGHRVALLVDRSPALVTGLLGAWMAGAVSVLLDPEHPIDRLRHQLEDAGVRTIFTTREPPAGLEDLEIGWVYLDAEREEFTGLPARPLEQGPSLDDPMYIVFTSGSTGRPKGVEVAHRSVANLVTDAVTRYGLGPADRVLQFASPGFDTLIEELLPALTAGALVVHRPPELFASFVEFVSFVAEERITVLDLPTAWWRAWVDEMERAGSIGVPEGVRLVIVGGEAAEAETWRAWRRLTRSNLRWVNTYGPSETTVVVAAFEPPPSWPGPAGASVPIGYPISGAHLTVVDSSGMPVPVGVPGELVVGSTPVALGYLTGVDPGGFRPDDGPGRTYHTGDLARLLPGGVFEYLGRIDDQVKVRGLRVEPGDVEAALLLDPEVRAAVVVASGAGEELRLTAHIVPVPDRTPDPGKLRARVARRLPEQMVPTGYVFHESLPLTASGKIDRAALAGWVTQPLSPVGERAPATALERALADLWAAVLEAPAVWPESDFFALGGHSLLGIKLLGRVGEELGVELPLRALFEEPTVAGMARLIEQRRSDG